MNNIGQTNHSRPTSYEVWSLNDDTGEWQLLTSFTPKNCISTIQKPFLYFWTVTETHIVPVETDIEVRIKAIQYAKEQLGHHGEESAKIICVTQTGVRLDPSYSYQEEIWRNGKWTI